ncbi:MAG: UDP-galactopyranose mutase [Bacteroidales bacterium]|jgi:UDP-galactopyranose mutase|nr:UDP-galactopyranose mutase [Bacteroidales bacterium]
MELKSTRFLVVGAGFFGSVIAERIANDLKEHVVVIDKRNHIGGNCYAEIHPETGIIYHKYGTHIFHTPSKIIWDYINRFAGFNGYRHQVLNTYKEKVYQMPINLETINAFYNINLKPFEVDAFLSKEIQKENITHPANFEEKAISLIGRPLYEAFIKGYTKKQWQKDPKELPVSILSRLPFRKNYDESYYFSRWQGIPINDYTEVFKKMLDHPKIEVHLNTDFFEIRDRIGKDTLIIYSGPIDQFFDYKFGKLEWRTLDFLEKIIPVEDYQGTSVMNYGEESVPYTRIHEPRHLHPEKDYPKDKTLIIEEYPRPDDGTNPFYPVNDAKNQSLILKYREEVNRMDNVMISGRLGNYKYYDMTDTIDIALKTYDTIKTRYHA